MASKTLNGKERPKNMIDPDDAVMLLIDHQSGLFQTVKDIEGTALRANVVTLAKVAALAKIPVITTASVPDQMARSFLRSTKYAPHAKYVARRGQINAWDNPDFVEAVEETKRKTLIIAGTITSVCLAFPSISAINEGYKVFAVVEASGTYSKMAQEITLTRLLQAGRYQSIPRRCVRKSSKPGAGQMLRSRLKHTVLCSRRTSC